MREILPDGSLVVRVRGLGAAHIAPDGHVLTTRPLTEAEETDLDAVEAEQLTAGLAAGAEAALLDRALTNHREEIRAAAVRLRQIETQGAALAESTPPPTSTPAEVKAAVDGQAVQIRAIARAAADMAAYLLEVGRIVLRDAT